MDLRPWNYYTPEGKAYPGTKEIVRQLESVIAMKQIQDLLEFKNSGHTCTSTPDVSLGTQYSAPSWER